MNTEEDKDLVIALNADMPWAAHLDFLCHPVLITSQVALPVYTGNAFFIFAVRCPILESQISITLHSPVDLVLSHYYIRSTFVMRNIMLVMKNIMLRLAFIYTMGRTCTSNSPTQCRPFC
jgi:hypothetical protein